MILDTHPKEVLWTLFFSAVLIGVVSIGMLIYVVSAYIGEIKWSNKALHLINVHAIVMPVGTIFFMGIANSEFRLMSGKSTRKVMYVHFVSHVIVFAITCFGLIAGIQSIQLTKYRHFSSAHSWLGLFFFAIYGLQFSIATVTFIFKIGSEINRDYFASIHAFFGVLGFVLACIVAMVGVVNKANYSLKNYGELTTSTWIINIVCITIVVFATIILFINLCPFFESEQFVLVFEYIGHRVYKSPLKVNKPKYDDLCSQRAKYLYSNIEYFVK